MTRADPLIVDVGANIGASLMQMKIAKPRSRVYCCEPSARFRPLLAQNIEANNWNDVTIVPALIGTSVDEQTVYVNTSTASAVARDYGSHGRINVETVAATTLDHLLADQEHVDFLKSDTDGFEYEVLRGGQELLERCRPTLHFEFAPWLLRESGHEPLELLEYLRAAGYRWFLILLPTGEPLKISDDPRWITGTATEAKYVDLVSTHVTEEDAGRELALFAKAGSAT